jgi:hypothetical protein
MNSHTITIRRQCRRPVFDAGTPKAVCRFLWSFRDVCSIANTRELNTIEQKSEFFAIFVSACATAPETACNKNGRFCYFSGTQSLSLPVLTRITRFCSAVRERERNRAEQKWAFLAFFGSAIKDLGKYFRAGGII